MLQRVATTLDLSYITRRFEVPSVRHYTCDGWCMYIETEMASRQEQKEYWV